jgi:outer membrane protein assembly factor BamB
MEFNSGMRSTFVGAALALLLAGCGGGHASSPLPSAGAPADGIGAQPPASSPARGDDWVTFARDVQRQSYETLPTGITQANVSTLQLKWVYPAGGAKPKAGFNASPIVVNGVVYVVDESGAVNALSAQTGKPLWAQPYVLPDSDITKMTPALYDGKLFVASYQDNGVSDTNYYFAALNPQNGQQLWITKLPGGVHGSPVAVNGIVYVPVAVGDPPECHPGGIYALNENTGAPVGSPLLVDPPQGSPDGGGVWSAISYDGAHLFYGTGNTCVRSPQTANSITALTPGASNPLWNINTADPLTDDDVGGTIVRQGDSGFAMAKNGYVYRVDVTTGSIIWKKFLGAPDGAGGFGTPSWFPGQAATGTLIVPAGFIKDPDTCNCANAGGHLFGLRLDGTARWQILTASPVVGYVALTPDLAFTPLDTKMAALDPVSGKVLWSSPLVGYSYASPVIVPSGLFQADESGRVYAFGLPSSGARSSSALSSSQILQLQQREPPHPYRKPKFCKVPVRRT